MKLFIYLILVTNIIFGCTHSNKDINNVQDKKEVLVPEIKHLYLGKINKNGRDTISFSFRIYNQSDKIACINKIDVSCSCVSLAKSVKPIPPKQSMNIYGTLNLKTISGHISKSIFVNYNNGALLVLRIVADVH